MNQAVEAIAEMEDEPAAKEEPKGAAKGKDGKESKATAAKVKEEPKPVKGKAAEDGAEDEADVKAKGKKAKADGEDEPEGAGGQGSGEEEDEDEEEENSISLAAMEAALLPQVLDTFDEISKTWKKITKVQEKRLDRKSTRLHSSH